MGEATDKMNTANWSEDRTSSTYDDDSSIASASFDDYDENTEQLRAGIEDTRAEMSQTINEIQERLSPENVLDQVKEKVRDATIGKVERAMNKVGETISEVAEPVGEVLNSAGSTIKETGRSAAGVINRNPIPVALIGLGIGMLAIRAFRKGNGYDYYDRSHTELGQTQYTTGGTLNQVKETASDLAHRSTEALNDLGTRAKDTASSFGNRFGQVLRENPLAVGAVAIAAGTAVGLVLPTTKFESEYIGETSERFVDKAQEVAREAIDKVQNATQQQMGSAPPPNR